MPDGTTARKQMVSGDQILEVIPKAILSWFNFTIGDISLGSDEVARLLNLLPHPSELLGQYLSAYEDRGDVLGLMIPVIRIDERRLTISSILLYLRREQLITIHDEATTFLHRLSQQSDALMKRLPTEPHLWVDRQTLLLARIMDEVSERNFSTLKGLIEQAGFLQIDLLRPRAARRTLTARTLELKRSVLTFLNATWAMRDVIHQLRYGDPEMISDDANILSKFEIILADLDRQLAMAEQLLELLTSGLSVMQIMMQSRIQTTSNLLSAVLLWLTILGTAVLIPNTLATIYGIPYLPLGPQDAWWILASLIGSTFIGTWIVQRYLSKKFGFKGIPKVKFGE